MKTYKRLFKYDTKTMKTVSDYGRLSESDIKRETRGYVCDKKSGVYTRKNARYGYFVIDD